jgi:hypothetical protein
VIQGSGLPPMPGRSYEKILGLNFGELEEEYVKLKGKKDSIVRLLRDLFDRGLISIDAKKILTTFEEPVNMWGGSFVTERKKSFLRFIILQVQAEFYFVIKSCYQIF